MKPLDLLRVKYVKDKTVKDKPAPKKAKIVRSPGKVKATISGIPME